MKIERIRNNNWTLSPLGRCDFLIAPLAEHIKNSLCYNRITLNTIRKKYPCTEKNKNPNVTKFKKKQEKCLNFAPKIAINPDYYWKLPVSQTCHKTVTNVSQTGHKYVTNTSQKWQF